MFHLDKLIRTNIKKLTPYSSARDEFKGESEIFLDANESPFTSIVNRYPDPLQKELKREITKIKNIPQENIFLGNGSDEIIDLLIRVFCEPASDNIVILPPTYGMYQVLADINNVEVKEVLLSSDFQIIPSNILKKTNDNSNIIFICSPNNPTGNLIKSELIIDVLKKFRGIVVVDEAYIDFSANGSMSSYLKEFSNLIILQTFSKSWGMAGVRLGISYASVAIIQLLNKIKMPYNVNLLTQQYVLDSMKNKREKDQGIKNIISQREILNQEFKKMEFIEKIYPSHSNFLLIKVNNSNKIYDYLKAKGIIVRKRSDLPLCENCLRITVGTVEENRKLLQTLFSITHIA